MEHDKLYEATLKEAIKRMVGDALTEYFDNLSQQDELMDIKDTSIMLKVSTKWIYNNAHKLPFAKKLSGKMWRFSRKGITLYLQDNNTPQSSRNTKPGTLKLSLPKE